MSKETSTKWDFARFITTLNTFGELPFLGSFRWLQEWMGQRVSFAGERFSAMDREVVAVGAVPSTVLSALNHLAPSIKVSSYEQKPQTYQFSLEEKHKLCELARSVDTVLIWNIESSASVGFSKTDFLNLVTALGSCMRENSEAVTQTVFDFTKKATDLSAWGALDDVVMGGVSEGAFLRSSDEETAYALFSGNVSTNNSGGFSSIRSQNFEPPYQFPGWEGLRLTVRGDGQRYKFILRNSSSWDSPGYIYGFDTVADEWIEVAIPFREMVPTFRAKSMPDAPAFDPTRVVSFQLMLSKFEYDKELNPRFSPGPFELAIAKISAYRERKGTPLVIVLDPAKTAKQAQEAALTDAGIPYKFIEFDQDKSSDEDLAIALREAIA